MNFTQFYVKAQRSKGGKIYYIPVEDDVISKINKLESKETDTEKVIIKALTDEGFQKWLVPMEIVTENKQEYDPYDVRYTFCLDVKLGKIEKYIPDWYRNANEELRESYAKEWSELTLNEDVDGFIRQAFKCPNAEIVRQKGVGYILTLHEDYDTTLQASNPCDGFSTTIRYDSKELSVKQDFLDKFLIAWSHYLNFQATREMQREKLDAEGLTLSARDGLVDMRLQIRIGIKDETGFAFHKLEHCYASLEDDYIDAFVPSCLDATKTGIVLDVIENLSRTAMEHRREDSLCNAFYYIDL